jgi:hypothetical protein
MHRGRVAAAALLLAALTPLNGGAAVAQDETALADSPITWTPGANDADFGELWDRDLAPVDAALAPKGSVVIVSSQLQSGFAVPVAWTSSDGLTWTPSVLKLPRKWQGGFPSGAVPRAIASTPSGVTLVGGDAFGAGYGLTATSVDGQEWELERLEELVTFVAVESKDSGLAVLARNACPTSRKACQGTGGIGYPSYLAAETPDPATWSGARIAEKGQPVHLAVSPEGVLLVAGYKGAGGALGLWRSTDGVTWSSVSPAGETPLGGIVWDLAWTPGGFMLAGHGGAWRSPDGLTWERVIESDGDVFAVGRTADDTLVFGDDRYWRSADGVTWDEVTAPEFGHSVIESLVTMDDGTLVLVGTSDRQAKQSGIRTWIGEQ